ncbi:MAG: hypothetical protein ACLFT8_01225, partial [Desulfovermiculus sp.]
HDHHHLEHSQDMAGVGAEDRGQTTEGRRQKTEDRGQRSDIRSQFVEQGFIFDQTCGCNQWQC